MPLTLTKNSRAEKIKSVLDAIMATYQQTIVKSEDELFDQQTRNQLCIAELNGFNLEPLLNPEKDSETYRHDERYGNKTFSQMVFCELIWFNGDNSDDQIKLQKKIMIFLKSQIPDVLKILKPIVDNHEIVHVMSELNHINKVIDSLDYCGYELSYESTYHNRPTNQSFDEAASHYQNINSGLIDLIDYLKHLATPIAIQELASYQVSLADMPVTSEKLHNDYPDLSDRVHGTFAAYFSLIARSINESF